MQAAVSSSSSCAAHAFHFTLPAFVRRAARRRMALASSSSATAAAAASSACFPSRSRLLSPSRAFSSTAGTDGSGKAEEASAKPWLLVGLGNPGKMYQGTRHNVGFEMLDAIAEAEGVSMSNVRFKAMFGKGSICNVPIILAKPQTFMNASGESVGSIVSYYKVPLNQVLLMYDDLDLPFSKLRLVPKGGHGGHNGMRSVIHYLKGNTFPRLRIGIGRPPGKMDPASFVLRPFNKKEREELDFSFERGVEAVRILVAEGLNKSATFVNSATSRQLLNN